MILIHVHVGSKLAALVCTLGICKLCWHNFEHYRDVLAFENNARIIGPIPKHYRANFTSVHKFQPKQVFLESLSENRVLRD